MLIYVNLFLCICKENVLATKNFIFLDEKWNDLASIARQAEEYIFSDPQSCLLKLRLFSESLVGYLYRDLNINVERSWTYFEKLTNDEFTSVINENILNKLHAIRIKGNKAAHEGVVSSEEALWLVQEAHRISLWLYSSYINGTQEDIKDFIIPVDSGSRSDNSFEIQNELEAALEREQNLQKQFDALKQQKDLDKVETFRLMNNNVLVDMNEGELAKRITIDEIFVDYKLTLGQEKLIESLGVFLEDRSQNVFLLKGYAGTGKTFITKGLTEYFRAIGRNCILAAPTGKAAKVIREKTGHKASTIHSAIYSNKDLKEYKDREEDRTYKFYFELNANEDSDDTVYIIDEASMLSDVYNEMEFFRFGTGHLLRDLLKYINLDSNDHNKKIIFIGDNAQLPPVGMNYSPALKEDYLLSTFGLTTQSFELTEVVRQKVDSGILKNAINLRKSLRSGIFNQLVIDKSTSDVEHVDNQNFMNTFLNISKNRISKDTVVISYTNEAVKTYNQAIREHFFEDVNVINCGDKIILVTNSNNYEIQLSNGDYGLVKNLLGTTEHKKIRLKRKNLTTNVVEEIDIELYFRDVEMIFKDENAKPYVITCKIIENLLFSGLPNLTSDEHKAIYLDFVMRHPHLRANTNEFKLAIKSDPYFNALRIKFGYAVTCHKAQGSEWKNVILDCSYTQNQLSEGYFRWLYTAMTRASTNLYVMNEPDISIFEKITSPNIDTTYTAESKSTILTKQEELSKEVVNNTFKIENQFLLSLYENIILKTEAVNIKVLDIIHNSYQERYTFEQEKLTSRVLFSYNSKDKITNISFIETNELSNKLSTLLASLKYNTVATESKEYLEFSQDFLEDFYININEKVTNLDILVINIEHNSWMERYTFSREEEVAVIDFYYNKKGQFKSPTPSNKSNSNKLVKDVLGHLS